MTLGSLISNYLNWNSAPCKSNNSEKNLNLEGNKQTNVYYLLLHPVGKRKYCFRTDFQVSKLTCFGGLANPIGCSEEELV